MEENGQVKAGSASNPEAGTVRASQSRQLATERRSSTFEFHMAIKTQQQFFII